MKVRTGKVGKDRGKNGKDIGKDGKDRRKGQIKLWQGRISDQDGLGMKGRKGEDRKLLHGQKGQIWLRGTASASEAIWS